MLKDIETIKMQGANFVSLTPLSLFFVDDEKDNGNHISKNVRGVLLYGRNGAGKSTIAKAFRYTKGEAIPAIKQVQFLDKDSNEVVLTEEEKAHLFVFDEEYVNRHVRLKEDHLDTIIMLGHAADLESKIENAEKEMKIAKGILEAKEAVFSEYQDEDNPKSPKYCQVKIATALRGNDAWAGRDRLINGGKQNASVRDDTYERFLGLKPEQSRNLLIVEFEEKINALGVAKLGSSKIEIKVPELPQLYSKYDDNALAELLITKIEKPELSEREQQLFNVVELERASELLEKSAYFSKPGITQCPYCFQSVSEEYRKNLVLSIEKVLSKVVKNHQEALQDHVFKDLSIDITPFVNLKSYQRCKELISYINSALQSNNELINQKIANPYKQIKTENLKISDNLRQLTQILAQLEIERVKFNQDAVDTRPIIERLNIINSFIAHYDIEDYVEEYRKQKLEYEKVETALSIVKEDYERKKKAVEELEAQRKNVKIALDIMNACLKYIFFAEDRMEIEYSDGEYRLLSRGKRVRPCDVSVGERNIIGLSYFFTSIMEKQQEEDVYGQEYLLVIDDPVSSYDEENRIGILSFLKYKLGEFLEGNEFSKAVVMTHDLMAFYDIHKIFEEIVSSCKKQGQKYNPIFKGIELEDGRIKSFLYKRRQEYTEILKILYSYGQGKADEYDIIIGNMMRQVLEAFSTFQYKKSIEEVSTDSKILELLGPLEYQSYYKNLMYRLVLNGGSHKEEQIKAMRDYEFFSHVSKEEKRRTAKEILCFIFLLNRCHILQHLQELKDVEITLDSWCEDIRKRAVLP